MQKAADSPGFMNNVQPINNCCMCQIQMQTVVMVCTKIKLENISNLESRTSKSFGRKTIM